MTREEYMRRANRDLVKADYNLQHANDKPNTTETELKNIKSKLEYAKIVYNALLNFELEV